MKRSQLLWIIGFTALTLVSLSAFLDVPTLAASVPKIYVFDPNTQGNVTTAEPNTEFTVEIRVSDVVELFTWGFKLNWTTTILDFVRVTEGPFLNSSGAHQSYFVVKKPGDTNWPSNMIGVADTLLGNDRSYAVTGSGVIAKVTFSVKVKGVSALDLWDTSLINFDLAKITHTVEDGYFANPLARIAVQPKEIRDPNLAHDDTFNINITIANVEKLYNYTVRLNWTSTVLDYSSAEKGEFLTGGGSTSFVSTPDLAGGSLVLTETLTAPSSGVNGSGTLAKITFKVKARGITNLKVAEVKMFKGDPDRTFIPAALTDGYFNNARRDVSVFSVELSTTSVAQGVSLNITVIVENNGDLNETFDLSVYYADMLIDTRSVADLAPADSKTVIFTWDTTNVPEGTYTIKAVAATLPGEVNTDNNSKAAASSLTIGSGGSGIPITMLLAAVAAVVLVVAAAGFLYMRSRK